MSPPNETDRVLQEVMTRTQAMLEENPALLEILQSAPHTPSAAALGTQRSTLWDALKQFAAYMGLAIPGRGGIGGLNRPGWSNIPPPPRTPMPHPSVKTPGTPIRPVTEGIRLQPQQLRVGGETPGPFPAPALRPELDRLKLELAQARRLRGGVPRKSLRDLSEDEKTVLFQEARRSMGEDVRHFMTPITPERLHLEDTVLARGLRGLDPRRPELPPLPPRSSPEQLARSEATTESIRRTAERQGSREGQGLAIEQPSSQLSREAQEISTADPNVWSRLEAARRVPSWSTAVEMPRRTAIPDDIPFNPEEMRAIQAAHLRYMRVRYPGIDEEQIVPWAAQRPGVLRELLDFISREAPRIPQEGLQALQDLQNILDRHLELP